MARWQFFNPETEDIYLWEINPENFSFEPFKRKVSNQKKPVNGEVIFEGRKDPQIISISGTILEQSQYDILMLWSQERKQIKITDDLGNDYWIYITKFDPIRNRKALHPFMFNYTLEAVILDWH